MDVLLENNLHIQIETDIKRNIEKIYSTKKYIHKDSLNEDEKQKH